MSVVTSLMYAAGAVALLAVALECCCRRRLRQFREPHLAALNGVNMNAVPYPVGAPAVGAAGGAGAGAGGAGGGGGGGCGDDRDCFFRSYAPASPSAPAAQHIVETPPPTYEQVMASQLINTNKTRPV